MACEVNSPEIIRLILNAGGDPNSRGHNSYTPTLVSHLGMPNNFNSLDLGAVAFTCFYSFLIELNL